MFSSPLPYRRTPDEPPARYAEALPPPLPASPLRNPPPMSMLHAYTAPGRYSQQSDGGGGWTEQFTRSVSFSSDRRDGPMADRTDAGRMDVPAESEAMRMVRMMSRRSGNHEHQRAWPLPPPPVQPPHASAHTQPYFPSPPPPQMSFPPDQQQYLTFAPPPPPPPPSLMSIASHSTYPPTMTNSSSSGSHFFPDETVSGSTTPLPPYAPTTRNSSTPLAGSGNGGGALHSHEGHSNMNLLYGTRSSAPTEGKPPCPLPPTTASPGGGGGGGMTMPNAAEYASIPSYGAWKASSVYSDSEDDSSESSEEEGEADLITGLGRSQRQRHDSFPEYLEHEHENEAIHAPQPFTESLYTADAPTACGCGSTSTSTCYGNDAALQAEAERRRRRRRRRVSSSFAAATTAAVPKATLVPERAASIGREGSVRSFRVGDEAGLISVSSVIAQGVSHEHAAAEEQELAARRDKELNEHAAPSRGKESEGVVRGQESKRSLVFSYHPLPNEPVTMESAGSLSLTSDNGGGEIKLFRAPTSFQLLSTSLKRLLADLMISAGAMFVPHPSAFSTSDADEPRWRCEVWVRTFALPMPLPPGGGAGIKGRKKRWMVGGGYRTMVGIEMDEEVTATPSPPVFGRTTSRASESGATSLTLTRTRSSRYSHSGHSGPAAPSLTRTTTSTSKPAATTSDSTNALVPTFTSSHVLRLRLPLPLYAPFTAAQLVETLHKHYQYGKRVGRSTSTSLAPGTIEENAYSFARMVDKAPGPVDEATRLSKAHKLGRTTMEGAPAIGRVDERGGEDIQGQAGRKGFRYTMRKAVSKAVGAVQGEREDTVEDDRANWVTPFTG